ncbi:MAG: hypothetical protein Q9171_002184 [Xanthocarpia ochracea]
MAQGVSPQSAVPVTRLTIAISPFEEFVQARKRPLSIIVPFYHSCYIRSRPADYLMSLLPRSTVLILRAVSHTVKDWAHKHHPDLLTRVYVTCPLPRYSTLFSSQTLRSLAIGCRQLTINVFPSAVQIHFGNLQDPSPARQIFNILNTFKTLRIEAPLTEAFFPLFSLRLALEQARLASLTELHVHQLTVPGLLALRWGGFDAFMDATWMGKTFWRSITSLRIGMTSDWLKWAFQELCHEQKKEQKARVKQERDIYRQGIQILHDWFFQFSLVENLRRVCFEWVGGNGLNPFLLDKQILKEEGAKWFSAPKIIWKGVNEVWLGGVYITTSDVTTLKQRFDGLEKLMVWEELAESVISGTVRIMEGRDWLDIDLTEDLRKPVMLRTMVDDGIDSWLCPFVLRL